MIPNPPGGLINAASPLDPHSRPYVLLQQLWVGEAGTSKNSTSSSAGRHRDTAGITSLIPDAGGRWQLLWRVDPGLSLEVSRVMGAHMWALTH